MDKCLNRDLMGFLRLAGKEIRQLIKSDRISNIPLSDALGFAEITEEDLWF